MATSYDFKTADVPGASATYPGGINDLGYLSGYLRFPDNSGQHGFINTGDHVTTIDVDGAGPIGTLATGLNNFGQVVGTWFDAGNSPHGFLYDRGTVTKIDAPDSATYLNGVNDLGQIAGISFVRSGEVGFVYDHGSFTTVAVPDALGTEAIGINNLGQVVGNFTDSAGHGHGFLEAGGKFTTLDVPGATITNPTGINNLGEIVGFYQVGTEHHGFVYMDGTYTTLDVPDSSFTQAQGVNDYGQITGITTDSTGQHGFVATPQSESALLGSTGITAAQHLLETILGHYWT